MSLTLVFSDHDMIEMFRQRVDRTIHERRV